MWGRAAAWAQHDGAAVPAGARGPAGPPGQRAAAAAEVGVQRQRLDAVGPGAGCVRQPACPGLRPACRRVAKGAAPAERLAGQAKEVAEAVQSLRTFLEGAKTSGSPKAARQKVGSPRLPSGPKLPSSKYN